MCSDAGHQITSSVWRGFPIRTPWDHSPVIDSPRLIADSYVLLRLLMPRHPPCALKNLTTKDQFSNFRENHENHPHPKRVQTDPGSYSWKLLLIKDARVHYVVLKQQPRTTHPTHNPQKGKPCDRCSQETRNTSPGSLTSRSCCLRTQQCAKHYPTTTNPPRSRTSPPKRNRPVLTNGPCHQAPIC